MTIQPRDLLFVGGPQFAGRYGILRRRTTTIAYRGEDGPGTFARAVPDAALIGRNGIYRLATTNIPRIDWYDLDGDGVRETPALLIEGARSNGWTFSANLDDAAWTKDGCTISANAGNGPDGAATADQVVEDTNTNLHGVVRDAPALTDNTRAVLSAFVAPAGRTWCHLATVAKDGSTARTWFNLATGAVGTQAAGHVAWVRGPFNGLYRLAVSFDALSGGTTPVGAVFAATGDNVTSYLGDGASGILLAGMQFEADQLWPSSPIATAGSTVTRAAETLSFPLTRGVPADITLYAKFVRPAWADVATGVASLTLCGLAGSASDTIRIQRNASNQLQARVVGGGAGNNSPGQAVPAGTAFDVCLHATDLRTAAKCRLNVGSGYGAFSSVTGPVASPWTAVRVGSNGASEWGDIAMMAVITAIGSYDLADFRALRP